MLGHDITVGWTAIKDFGIMPSPLDAEQEHGFADHFKTQLESLAESDAALTGEPRLLRTGGDNLFDLSSQAARAAFGASGVVVFDFDEPIRKARATRLWLSAAPPHQHEAPVPATIDGNRLLLDVPVEPPEGSFRCVLRLTV